MAVLGYWAFVLTLVVSVYAALASVVGAQRRVLVWLESGRNAAYVATVATTIACLLLLVLVPAVAAIATVALASFALAVFAMDSPSGRRHHPA
jgi:hypothetical protein